MHNILEVQKIVKRYGDYVALNEVSLTVPQGSIYGLLGPNGAGKTSLIRIINQITMPDSGVILLDGQKLRPEHVRDIGYLPEERGLYKSMKVGEQCLYLAQMKGLSKAEAKKQLDYWFDKLEIKGWWNKKIQELSKGMAQKVQFVVTVLHNPKLLMESVEELCDDIALIHQANKLIEGKLDSVKRQYRANTYEVGILTSNVEGLMFDLTQKFKLTQSNFKSLNDELKLEIEIGNAPPNELLNILTTRGQVTHFVEKIPTVNDIFIQAVSQ